MPSDIKEVLRAAAPQPRRDLDMAGALRRGRRLSWRFRLLSLSAVVIVGAGAWTGMAAVRNQEGRKAEPPPPGRSAHGDDRSNDESATRCREQRGVIKFAQSGRAIRAVTPVVVIASGKFGEEPWIWCAYRAELEHRGDTSEGFCDEFRIASPPYAGWTCGNTGWEASPGVDYFHRSSYDLEDRGRAYFGAVSNRVERVVLETTDGDEVPAPVYDSPQDLGVDYRFFVGFATPEQRVRAVSVRNAVGQELAHEDYDR